MKYGLDEWQTDGTAPIHISDFSPEWKVPESFDFGDYRPIVSEGRVSKVNKIKKYNYEIPTVDPCKLLC